LKRLLRYKIDYIKYSLGELGIYKFDSLSSFGILKAGVREIKSIKYILENIQPKFDTFKLPP